MSLQTTAAFGARLTPRPVSDVLVRQEPMRQATIATAADGHPNELVDELTARIGLWPANAPAR